MTYQNIKQKHPFNPAEDSIEGKALFLEASLERMIEFADRTRRKLKWQENNNQPPQEVLATRERLESLNQGINEVWEKASKIWKDIQQQGA